MFLKNSETEGFATHFLYSYITSENKSSILILFSLIFIYGLYKLFKFFRINQIIILAIIVIVSILPFQAILLDYCFTMFINSLFEPSLLFDLFISINNFNCSFSSSNFVVS